METSGVSRKELWAMKVRELVPTYKFAASAPHGDRITSSRDADTILRPLFGEMIDESVWAIYVDGAQHVLAVYRISEGSTAEAAVSPAKVIRGAVLVNAAAIIVAHNHPSGSATPSAADRALTEELVKLCDMMHLPLLDHVIIANGSGTFSFCDHGLIDEYRRQAKR